MNDGTTPAEQAIWRRRSPITTRVTWAGITASTNSPAKLLKKIPGLELCEMPDAREDSLCCGGGGGRIWMETPKDERFSDLRLAQAIGIGAEVLVTSCPYCITNFEDSRMNREDSDAIEVKDITEVIQEVIS